MDRPEPSPAPPRSVLGSFSLEGQRRLMAGGRGRAWRVGEAVLKRVDVPLAQLGWQASLFDSLQAQTAFRVPTAVMSREGSLTVEGWYAMTFLRGRHEPGRWVEIISAGEAFHSAVASEPRPVFLDERDDPWSIGDRAAWGEIEIPDLPETKHLARLVAHLRSLEALPQLIHGDLTGNVFFDDALPPAILDLSPYFRPVPFATAVVVADALAWEGADSSLLEHFDQSADFPQYLLRAVIYRVVTDRHFRPDQPLRLDDDDPYQRVVDLAVARASHTPA